MIGVVLDVETYSPLPLAQYKGEKGVGAYRYSEPEEAAVLCSSCLMFNSKLEIMRTETRLGTPSPSFFEGVDLNNLVLIAHNANFERRVLRYWSEIMLNENVQWYCTASHASSLGIGRSLEMACSQLNLATQKDTDRASKLLIRLKEVPRTKERFIDILNDTQYMADLMIYCQHDTEATYNLFLALNKISPWPKWERHLYKIDQKINDRGFLIDIPTVDKICKMVTNYKDELNGEIARLTDGRSLKITEYKVLGELLEKEGVHLPNFQKSTIDEALKQDGLTQKAYALLSLKGASTKGAVTKYEAMLRYACKDNRVRGVFMYYGAHTGRWSGKGVQPHNFPKLKMKAGTRFSLERFMEAAKSPEFNPNFLEEAGSILRYMIIPEKGKLLHVVDYANIEPRLVFWLTDCQQGIEDLKGDIYLAMASEIFGEPVTTKSDPRRDLGKAAIISFNYGQKAKGFMSTCEDKFGITDMTMELAEKMVKAYSNRYHQVINSGYMYLKAASEVTTHDTHLKIGKIEFYKENNFLCMKLPSGSIIRYFKPIFDFSQSAFEKIIFTLSERAIDKMRKEYSEEVLNDILKMRAQKGDWRTGLAIQEGKCSFHDLKKRAYRLSYQSNYGNRTETHGGKIIENAIQRLARDVFANGLVTLDECDFNIVLHVHDEIVCEESTNRLEDMKRLMLRMPDWLRLANEEPYIIPNEGSVCERYEK